MYKGLQSIYHKIKAAVLLLCLSFMVLSACPIQKFLLSASSVKVEALVQVSNVPTVVNTQLSCSASEEIVKTPLVEQAKESNINALNFIFLSTLAFLFTSFIGRKSVLFTKRKDFLSSPIPLFLRNQVFII